MTRLYTPPPGFVDLPYSWAFDASALTNGADYINLLTYIKGGYGDFVMRRVVGLNRILDPTGTYQLQDRNLAGLSQIPIIAASADDIGIVPELLYKEQDSIRMNIANVALPTPAALGQVAFQGVRRMRSNSPQNPTYRAHPKTYTYQVSIPVNAPVGSMQRAWVPITDYDFELYQIILLKGTLGTLGPAPDDPGGIFYTQVNAAIPVTITTTTGNAVLSANLSGSTLTINLTGTDTVNAVLAVIQAVPGISGVVTTAVFLDGTQPYPFSEQGTFLLAATVAPLTAPISTVWLYDVNRTAVSNIPLVDIYMDGGPGGVYKNGAIVTPLWYQKDSSIQIDVYSQDADGGKALIMYLVGRKYYPC